MAVAVVLVTVWSLVKRFETRLVLLVAGLVMALLSGDPMAAFRQLSCGPSCETAQEIRRFSFTRLHDRDGHRSRGAPLDCGVRSGGGPHHDSADAPGRV